MKILPATFIIFSILSCSNNREKTPNSEHVQHIDTRISSGQVFYTNKVIDAISKNDEREYKECATWFRFHPCSDDFMYYAIEMAYKNHSPSAYNDIVRFYNATEYVAQMKDSAFYFFQLYNLARSNELGYNIKETTINGVVINKSNIKNSGYYLKKLPHSD